MKENNWFDPFYIQSHLSEEESNIQKNVRDFCNNELKPTVVERNRKNEFDQKLYSKFGSLGVLGQTIKTCLLYTSPSPRDRTRSRMPSSA